MQVGLQITSIFQYALWHYKRNIASALKNIDLNNYQTGLYDPCKSFSTNYLKSSPVKYTFIVTHFPST